MAIVHLLYLKTSALLLSSIIAIFSDRFGTAKATFPRTFIGVNYGMQGDNLPPATEVIKLYKQNEIGKIRLFDPDPSALQALRGSEISVTLHIRNEDLSAFASSHIAVEQWFAHNVEPYLNDVKFSYLVVGNEVIPGNMGPYVLPVMESLKAILDLKNIAGIKVTTVVPTSSLSSSYPPSIGKFSVQAANDLRGVLRFLTYRGSPLMINIYPYFAYASDPTNVSLDFALFTATSPVIQDGSLSYYNLFDAMVDAFFSAMEGEGVPRVDIVVSETGWPSAGNGAYTTPNLAAAYNRNFIRHILIGGGTPKRRGAYIEGFLFAMFNENLKPNGVEQNFGLFYPNMTSVYPLFS